MLSDSKVMQVERKWHVLLTIFFLLITSGQCMDSKEDKQKERRTLLDLILQVIRDSQQREKPISRRCSSGLFTSAQDMKFSSREKPFYVPRLDNSRLSGKLIRFIFRFWWWRHNPHFTVGDSCQCSGQCCKPYSRASFSWMETGLFELNFVILCVTGAQRGQHPHPSGLKCPAKFKVVSMNTMQVCFILKTCFLTMFLQHVFNWLLDRWRCG